MARRATPHPVALAVGSRIRRLRHEQHVTLEQLAAAGGPFSKPYLSDLERGFVVPTIATIADLAARLNVRPIDLVADPDEDDRDLLVALTRYMSPKAVRAMLSSLIDMDTGDD